MATVNLGRIKPVFRGAYSGSTAYVIDDIVTSGGSSYICIQAHGAGTQAVTQTAYWSVLASTGTDVGATLTTSGDILYRDGSGLQRLAKGTASQTLQMDGSAAFPTWTTVAAPSSDVVKLGAGTIANSATGSVDGFFSTDYDNYKIFINNLQCPNATNGTGRIRFNTSGSAYTSSNYQYNFFALWRSSGSAGDSNAGHGWSENEARWSYNNIGQRSCDLEITMFKPATTGSSNIGKKHATITGVSIHQDGTSADYVYGHVHINDVTALTGITLYNSSGNISFTYRVYGFKN